MASTTKINVEFKEKEIVNVDFRKVDLIPKIRSLDAVVGVEVSDAENRQVLVHDGTNWVNTTLNDLLEYFTIIEEPTKITSKKFQTTYNWISGTLQVYLNGLEEKHITELTSNTFEFDIDTVDADTIRVRYLRQ